MKFIVGAALGWFSAMYMLAYFDAFHKHEWWFMPSKIILVIASLFFAAITIISLIEYYEKEFNNGRRK